MQQLHRPLALLSVLFAVSFAAYLVARLNHHTVPAEILLNVASVALGIIATTWLIDRTISEKADLERRRLRRIAFEQLKRPLNHHLSFLQAAYKASSTKRPDKTPKDVGNFFGKGFFEAMRRLDLSKDAPVHPPRSWAVHISQECDRLVQSIRSEADRYISVLEADEVRRLNRLANSQLVSFARHLPILESDCGANGRRLGNSFDRADGMLADHVDALKSVIDLANALISPLDQVDLDHQRWADNIAPKFGDAVFGAPSDV